MTPIMKYNFNSKTNHLCPFPQLYGINYDNINQYKENDSRLGHLLSNINTKLCVYKIDKTVSESDIIHGTSYTELAKSFFLKMNSNENLEDYFKSATCFLKQTAIEEKMKFISL